MARWLLCVSQWCVFLIVVCLSVVCVSQCCVFLCGVCFLLACVYLCCVFLSGVCFSVACYGWRLIKCGSRVQMVSRLTGRYRSQCHSRQPCPHSAGLSILSTLLSLHSCTSSLQLLLKCHSTDFTAWCSVPVSLATTLPAAVW